METIQIDGVCLFCSCEDHYQEIEKRTKYDVSAFLFQNGIMAESQNWFDYSKAKRVIFKGHWIDSNIYDKQIGWITKYLDL